MSELKVVTRVTLGEQVALQLADMITDRHWEPGDKLPPEMELCEALGVGRSTLREALKSLAFIGMVRMRAGDGTYVSELPHRLLDRILTKGLLKTEQDLADVCETRKILEAEAAALAAERASGEDIANLRRLVAGGRSTLIKEPHSFPKSDIDFHFAVASVSHNKLLPRLLSDIRGLLGEWIKKSQKLPGLRENAQEQHERIFECIAQRSPADARVAMQAHLETFERAYTLLGHISDSSSGRQAHTAKNSLMENA